MRHGCNVFLLLAVYAFALFAGCDRLPDEAVPDVGAISLGFSFAREDGYSIAVLAKNELGPVRLSTGRQLYVEAAKLHNQAIEVVRAAIAPNGSVDGNQVQQLLSSADAARQKLKEWSNDAFAERKGLLQRLAERIAQRRAEARASTQAAGATCGAAVPEVALALAELAIEVVNLYNERVAARRKFLDESLDRSRWPDWGSIQADR